MKFAPGGEFEFISQVGKLCPELPGHALGIGDDGAIWQNDRVFTLDISVEEVHFSLRWSSISQAVEKCLLSNLSDLNAMGAVAEFGLCGITRNKSWSSSQMAEISAVLGDLQTKFAFPIIGGDTVTGDQGAFQFMMAGKLKNQALKRSGARPGDQVWVSGYPGMSHAGLSILMDKHSSESNADEMKLIQSHLLPEVPLELGPWLAAEQIATSAIDLSDGLSSELHHIAAASGCGLRIHREKLPVNPILERWCIKKGHNPIDFCLLGGEDYELLFTKAPDIGILDKYGKKPLTCIGEVFGGSGVEVWENNEFVQAMPAKSWVHF